MYKIEKFSILELAEPLGTKEKYWTKNKEFLFKVGRANTQEDISEKIACEIANLINLPSAQYELAICQNGITKQGVASKNFLQEGQVLILGNEMLPEIDRKYPKDRDKKDWHRLTEYTLDKVLILIKASQMLKRSKKDILRNFVGYLVFDCLIGNQDRHHENWGFIIDKKSLALAPSFDHASGIASKVSDKEAKERLTTKDKNYNVEAYCKKARTPFYKNVAKLKTFEVVKELIGMQNGIKTYTIEWIDKILRIKESDYQGILDKIPKDITQNQKDFITKMLLMNTKILQEIKDGTNE